MSAPPPASAAQQVEQYLLGHQPILDRKLNLHAFELSFAFAEKDAASGDALAAAASLINAVLHNPDVGCALGPYKGFIGIDETLLASDLVQSLPTDRIGVRITASSSEHTVQQCRELKARGFELSLEGYSTANERHSALIELVDHVAIDVRHGDMEKLRSLVRHLRRWPVKLLAKNVEEHSEVAHCLELGIDLFQGYFFAKPRVIPGKHLLHSELSLLKLLGLVNADADPMVIENVLKEDPSLAMDLLRLTNSAASGIPHRITSLSQAIIVLGRRQLERWLQLLLFSRLAPPSAFPSPLLQLAATRSRFMELVALTLAPRDKTLADRAFLAGVISLMDALFGQPLAKVIEHLYIPLDVRVAVLERQGLLGKLLRLAEQLEHGGDDQLFRKLYGDIPELDLHAISEAHILALTWANNLGSETP
ncbi:MAG: EAL and HDOD domain-containing protein [Burkholderiales bacterium]